MSERSHPWVPSYSPGRWDWCWCSRQGPQAAAPLGKLPSIKVVTRSAHSPRRPYTHLSRSKLFLIRAGAIEKYREWDIGNWNVFGRAVTISSRMRILTGDTAVRSQINPLDTAIHGNQRPYRGRALWSEAVGHGQPAVTLETSGAIRRPPCVAAAPVMWREDQLSSANATRPAASGTPRGARRGSAGTRLASACVAYSLRRSYVWARC
jgi:hypothetical protein